MEDSVESSFLNISNLFWVIDDGRGRMCRTMAIRKRWHVLDSGKDAMHAITTYMYPI